MSQDVEGNTQNERRPQEEESGQELPRVLDKPQGELFRVGILVVSAVVQRPVPHAHAVHLLRRHSRGLALVVGGEPVCSVLNHLLDASVRSLDQGPVQCSEALGIPPVHICAPPEQDIHTGGEALVCRPHQAGVALGIRDVDVNVAMVQQQDELEDVAVQGGAVQQVVALVIRDERVSAMLEEEVDDAQVAFLRGP